MLDDTYILTSPSNNMNNIRATLQYFREDQVADGFGVWVQSGDLKYVSVRIFKADRNIRYMYKIHEVIDETNRIVCGITEDRILVNDLETEYHKKRSFERTNNDVKFDYGYEY